MSVIKLIKMRHFGWLLLGVLLFATTRSMAQQIPPRPDPPRLVNDLAGMLAPDQVALLEEKLVAYDDSTSDQVAIVTLPSLNDYPIEEVGLAILRGWGIGTKENNNGILILLAGRKVRIEVGTGLEGAVPDAIANRIIDENMIPNFKQGHFYEGLNEAVDQLMLAAAGEYKGSPRSRKDSGGGGAMLVVLIIIVIIISILRNRGGGGGTMISRRGWGGWIGPVGGFGDFGGGGRGGGGGGGFGGFGGGSGSGGGASGSW